MPAELVCATLQMAIAHRQSAAGLIEHTDRGSQYASELQRDLLKRHHLLASMGWKGNCWDNAVMESFFLNLKRERVWQADYANHGEAIYDITDYIVVFYNSTRQHSTLGYLPPNADELQIGSKTPYHGV
jgi:transposase InsO family protein